MKNDHLKIFDNINRKFFQLEKKYPIENFELIFHKFKFINIRKVYFWTFN